MTAEVKNSYDEYLRQHIGNVQKAYTWLCTNLPEIIDCVDNDSLMVNIYSHDQSKYSDEEYEAYAEYFYGTESKEHDLAFDYAWLHHQHVNPHHWQYWLLQNDQDGLDALEMSKEAVVEMFCDHWAFSWAKNNLYEVVKWYDKNKRKMNLHPNTRKFYEDILQKVTNKLDAQENI